MKKTYGDVLHSRRTRLLTWILTNTQTGRVVMAERKFLEGEEWRRLNMEAREFVEGHKR